MLTKKEKVVRSNTRITPEQSQYIKDLTKKTGNSEGEVFREIISFYIEHNKTDNEHPL